MTGSAFVRPAQSDKVDDPLWQVIMGVVGSLNGDTDWQRLVRIAISDNASYAVAINNAGTGGSLNAGNGKLQVTNTGVSISTLFIIGDLGVGGALDVVGAAVLHSTLGVTGATTLGTLSAGATGLTSLGVSTSAVIGTTLAVTGATTLTGALAANGGTTTTTLTATGNVALGDANADVHTIIGATTFRNVAAAVQLFIDAANDRVLVSTGTALTSAASDIFSAIGGISYFAGAPGPAIGIRYGPTETVGWTATVEGAGANRDLLWLDDGGVTKVRFGDTSSTYGMVVTGSIGATAAIVATTDIVGTARGVFGASAFSGAETLRNVGATRLEGLTTITTGGINVTGGIVLASSGNIDGNGGTAGQIRIGAGIFGAASLTGSEVLKAAGLTFMEKSGTGLTEVLRLQNGNTAAGDGPAINFYWNTGTPQLGAQIGINPTGAAAADLVFLTGNGGAPTTKLSIQANGDIVPGSAALATNATGPFMYLESCAGTPTGTPTTYTGRVPMVFDTTGSKLWILTGGTWKGVVVA